MTRVPRITAKELVAFLEKMGFSQTRQSGSHKIFRNPDGIRVTVPDHAGKTIHPKIIKAIIVDLKMSLDEFCGLL